MAIGAKLIQGDKELKSLLKHMRTTSARRVTTAGAAESGKQLAKMVKATIPARFKGARKAIGWRRLKVKEAAGGGAKIGGRVGRSSRASSASRKRDNRKGVGIGANNIHWFIQDAKHRKRYTGKKRGVRRYTGVMLSHTAGIPSVSKTANRNSGVLRAAFTQAARKQLNKEIAKGKAFKA